MSNNTKRALRRYKTYVHAKNQQKIHLDTFWENDDDRLSFTKNLGKYKKQNAMDCGQTNCIHCGNPRNHKAFCYKWTYTLQEQKSDINYREQLSSL
jgi:hypothetical protein